MEKRKEKKERRGGRRETGCDSVGNDRYKSHISVTSVTYQATKRPCLRSENETSAAQHALLRRSTRRSLESSSAERACSASHPLPCCPKIQWLREEHKKICVSYSHRTRQYTLLYARLRVRPLPERPGRVSRRVAKPAHEHGEPRLRRK